MTYFEWDPFKNMTNVRRQGIDFGKASEAFQDPKRKIVMDSRHSGLEERFYCIGMVRGKVCMVRFIYRGDKIRIFGAGYWRKGREYYEKTNH